MGGLQALSPVAAPLLPYQDPEAFAPSSLSLENPSSTQLENSRSWQPLPGRCPLGKSSLTLPEAGLGLSPPDPVSQWKPCVRGSRDPARRSEGPGGSPALTPDHTDGPLGAFPLAPQPGPEQPLKSGSALQPGSETAPPMTRSRVRQPPSPPGWEKAGRSQSSPTPTRSSGGAHPETPPRATLSHPGPLGILCPFPKGWKDTFPHKPNQSRAEKPPPPPPPLSCHRGAS